MLVWCENEREWGGDFTGQQWLRGRENRKIFQLATKFPLGCSQQYAHHHCHQSSTHRPTPVPIPKSNHYTIITISMHHLVLMQNMAIKLMEIIVAIHVKQRKHSLHPSQFASISHEHDFELCHVFHSTFQTLSPNTRVFHSSCNEISTTTNLPPP